jgi:oligopeptide transport system substrate-binding protein
MSIGMWQNVLGIGITPDPIDFNRLLTEITDATDNPKGLAFWCIDWIADYPDPQDWLTLQFAKGAPNNNDNYGQNNSSDASTQQQVQQQLVAADSMTNPTARLQAYNHAEQQLINDVAWLPVNQVSLTYLLKPYVIGVVDNMQDPDGWANSYIASH